MRANAVAFVEFVLLNYDHRMTLLNEEACALLATMLHQERCEELLVLMCQNWNRFEALIEQYRSNPSYMPGTTIVLNIFRLVDACQVDEA